MELNRPAISLEDLHFSYVADQPVLMGINLNVKVGEKVAVLGRNGAGKTTLFSILSGINHDYQGKVTLAGRELKQMSRPEISQQVALVPQKHEPLFPYLTRDFIMMGRFCSMGLFGSPGSEDLRIVEEAAIETGAARFLDRPYSTLSGGEMQLVLIARALAQQSEILVLDEPNTHLDYRNRFLVLDMVRKLAEARQMTLIMSLHDPNDVIQFAERVVVMHEGRIVADGRPVEVIDEALLAEYFGIRAVALKNAAGNLIFKAVEAI